MTLQKSTLPLVEIVCSYFPGQSLENIRIIGIQNLLPTTFRMFLSLFKRGLNPVNVTLIGKCYSTSPEVMEDLKTLGCDVADLSTFFDPGESYDTALHRYLDDYFQRRICTEDYSPFSKVIVMDDGGEFLEKMQSQTQFSGINLIGIEQTTSGYNKLKDQFLRFPIINVGRSVVKLKYEAPLIAWTVVNKLAESLNRLSDLPKTVAVIGSGPIGNSVISFLEKLKRFSITHVMGSKEFTGFKDKLGEFDMIIGCTGRVLFQEEDFCRLKPGVILVSASYSDGEFNAAYLRTRASKISSCHQDVNVNGIRLLNCGFPVNFDDHFDTVDPEIFQLTRSLLTAAIYQAMNTPLGNSKFVDLDLQIQKRIEEAILKDPFFQEILSCDLE